VFCASDFGLFLIWDEFGVTDDGCGDYGRGIGDAVLAGEPKKKAQAVSEYHRQGTHGG
jgi:hypothetical protein